MILSLSKLEILIALSGLYEKYLITKTYFDKHSEEEVIGMSTPNEIKEVYNNILNQVQSNGEYITLNKIK